uniref:Uncharacterized protein n=1 Tax=Triticum urartu TaxID=4572 RepID=A0A8R7TV50_TRIUA
MKPAQFADDGAMLLRALRPRHSCLVDDGKLTMHVRLSIISLFSTRYYRGLVRPPSHGSTTTITKKHDYHRKEARPASEGCTTTIARKHGQHRKEARLS